MELNLQIKMNAQLYLRDPEQSELGKKIVRESIGMIHEMGLEDFTFKKLAARLNSTEASIYRYFENKHRLLVYITTWFWTLMEYQLVFHTNNITEPEKKIETVIDLLCFRLADELHQEHIDTNALNRIVIAEGNKAYLTKHVEADNRARLFKPYKDLCHRIAEIFLEYNPSYPFPHSLASTLIETAHHQFYFREYLPSLTDFRDATETTQIPDFLRHFIFNALNISIPKIS